MTIDEDYYGKYKAINMLYYLGEDEKENNDNQDDEYTIDECRLDGNWNDNIPSVFTHTDESSFRQILTNILSTSTKDIIFIDLFETESQKNRAVEFFKSFIENKDFPEDVRMAVKNWYLSDKPCFRVLENIDDAEIPNMKWKLIEEKC